MSYQARIRIPPFRGTGRTGAFGKTNRQARAPPDTSSGTMGSKSCPSAPNPCSQITAAFGFGAVSTSIVSSMLAKILGNLRQLDHGTGHCARNSAAARVTAAIRYHRRMPIALNHLRRYAIARSLFKPTTLMRAIQKLGFVQADPIRAPARAQDLTLRHRVTGYRAGDLERRYPKLGLEEDFFINYGFLPRDHHALMHPRTVPAKSTKARAQMEAVLAFVQARGIVHPREVDAHFSHGRVTNWFGGTSNASTQLLNLMHYRGLLRVAGRDNGTRIYVARELEAVPIPVLAQTRATVKRETAAKMDALVDVIVRKYAPLPANSL